MGKERVKWVCPFRLQINLACGLARGQTLSTENQIIRFSERKERDRNVAITMGGRGGDDNNANDADERTSDDNSADSGGDR